jgi:hypothetical protein
VRVTAQDVPSPVGFSDITQARAWVTDTGSGKNTELLATKQEQPALLMRAGFVAVSCLHEDGGMALHAAYRPA